MNTDTITQPGTAGGPPAPPIPHQKDHPEMADAAGRDLQRSRVPYTPPVQEPDIYTVAAWKGGVGKTTLAYELAYVLDAVFADFDWDRGGGSVAWGYRSEERVNAPLLDALEKGSTPRVLQGGGRKPDLIPCHPDFGGNQPEPEALADALEEWSQTLKRRIVVDTHPGGCNSTYGALQAARVVIVPVVLENKPMEALEGMLRELADYPLLLVPNMVQVSNRNAGMRKRLLRLVDEYNVEVGPPVSYHKWVPPRTKRIAIGNEDTKQAEPFVDEIRDLAEAVLNFAPQVEAVAHDGD